MIAPALADVAAKRTDNGRETDMSPADAIPFPSTSEEGAALADLNGVFEPSMGLDPGTSLPEGGRANHI